MAKDIVQATNNKGVAGWSLKTDDNATVDPTINWQEGQAPSTVNNSARAMMTRIREEHDLIDNRIKGIENGWGSRFLYVEVGSYTLERNNDGDLVLNMVIADKLTDEQYADLQKGELLLAVNWGDRIDRIAIENDPLYKTLTTQDVITLSLSIPTASTTHLWKPFIALSFFGTWHETNEVTPHELPYIVNNLMEYVAEQGQSNRVRTLRSIPMDRSYIDIKIVEVKDDNYNTLNVTITWYYISPCEIILTVEPKGATSDNDKRYVTFIYDLGISWDNLIFLDGTIREGVVNVFNESPPRFGIARIYNGPSISKWDGTRYRFHAKLTTDAHFKLYPMNTYPVSGIRTYPIIT